ncbi:MAG: flavodoxin family protein, partial [Clostridia bacterium]|nr:flavodoxin family protein [Clostridia bacterium]
MQCFKNGPCSQKDDMIPLYDEIEKADMIVLASPIYFWQITAQTKAVIDRMYALYVAGRFQRKDTAAIFVSGGDADCCDEAVSFYKNVIINRLHWNDKGMMVCPRTSREGFELAPHLEKAYEMGKNA